nr:ATP-binding protein [Pleurocapsa sp. FMAR1]
MISGQYTILIVDDSTEERAVYRRYLNQEKLSVYQLVEAESGEKGLSLLESIQPDLILLGYLLPDFDGLEFLTRLKRQLDVIPPTIMITGRGNEMVAVEAMKSGVKDYLVKDKLTPEILTTSVQRVLQQHHLQSLLTKNIEKQQLIAETSLRIRQTLDISSILDTAVKEVQILLNCDRVVVYRFAPDLTGNIVAESVISGQKPSLGANIIDTCFQEKGLDKYERGEILAINDVYKAGFSQCHLQLLEEFQVKANVIVPILLAPSQVNRSIWGLLIAHQCSYSRHWQKDEIELLDKLSVQLAIAIQQAELIDNLQSELKTIKQLETELERLVQVLEASQDYIGLVDTAGKVIWNNPQMKHIRGITDDKPAYLSIVNYYPDWAYKIIQEEGIPTAIAQGSWLGETAILDREGQEIPVSQLILAHKSADGIEYISTVMRDLTKQKQTEKSLQERVLELKWVNRELLKTTALLKKRNQELDHFAYVTSHDLKAPLRAIANLATWLGEDLAGEIPEENQQQLQLMQSRVQRLEGLIQGLLEYSRVGRKNNLVKTIDVGNLVKEVIDSLSPPPEFSIFVAADLPTIKTEVVLLRQVFANLIDNAIKYHPQKSGKITISAQNKNDFYEFAVSDDGQGIDPQYHERIFTIFQTLQARDTFESTGIGLSIVKKIVEDRGGMVRVESKLGEGSTFFFTWRKQSQNGD